MKPATVGVHRLVCSLRKLLCMIDILPSSPSPVLPLLSLPLPSSFSPSFPLLSLPLSLILQTFQLPFSIQECTDNCCNANTCQLAAGAQCSAGACCNSTCQFRSYGATCRAATGECDIAEYCSGNSGECPADDHRLDGTACASNTGYCFEGDCPSHDAQCRFHFGMLDHVMCVPSLLVFTW